MSSTTRKHDDLLPAGPTGGDEPGPAHPEPVTTLVHAASVRYADRAALISSRVTLTHNELAARVTGLARRIAEAGAGPGSRVAVCAEPGWEHVVGALAVLWTGATCVPVPPDLNRAARWQRLAVVGARVLVTQPWLEERLDWHADLTVLTVDAADSAEAAGPVEPPFAHGGTLALIGAPEGGADPLILSSAAVARTIEDVNQRLGLTAADRLLGVTPLASERAFFDILGPLTAGGALVLPDDIDLRNPAAWIALAAGHAVTVWSATPTLTRTFLDFAESAGDTLPVPPRRFAVSGEPLPRATAERLRALAGHEGRVLYLGEGADPGIWATCMAVGDLEDDWGWVPLGGPLADRTVRVLSDSLTPCPVWVTGGVHHDDPDTAVPDAPLRPSAYLGRELPSGVIEFAGDRAARMWLNERPLNLLDVELALWRHESVAAAVVVSPTGTWTVAYVKPEPGSALSGEEVRAYLRRMVSPYLLPERVELVLDFPTTPDGRVDRSALTHNGLTAPHPHSEAGSAGTAGSVPALDGDLLKGVEALASRLLGVSPIEPHMNLLDLGATSVDLVRLATAVEEEHGIVVDVPELLKFPSLAVLVSGHTTSGTADTLHAVNASAPSVPRPSDGPATDDVLHRLQDRQALKDRRPGLRHDLDDAAGIDLAPEHTERIALRRTVRRFGGGPVPAAAVEALLAALRETDTGAGPHRAYPSAGGAYSVQVYAVVKAGAVDGLPGGCYYHHPVHNRLVPLTPVHALHADDHHEVNRAVALRAGFAIHLVGRTEAVRPLYGELAEQFMAYEAGAIGQLLMTLAAEYDIGLCPVAGLRPDTLVGALDLAVGDVVLHTLLGGAAPDPGGDAG
ncbi:AMP-binding protein [Streptomyces massasporeus]|uniref:AMP-binding protein n=1 Tax=Streptomyces massasporeus TaxID=67324 RepID=UPI0036FF71E9